MNFASLIPYTLNNNSYLSEIFTEIPNNAFINKGRCGNGGNYLELNNRKRCTLLVVPTREIIYSMIEEDETIQPFYSEITSHELTIFLKQDGNSKKVISTPESLRRIMEISSAIETKNSSMWELIKSTWFLLLDECHSYISESYREDILIPFKYFFDFKFKAIMSATPYYFTDKRMRSLNYHKVTINGSLGNVKLINSTSVQGTLKEIILNAVAKRERTFIFYNSVTAIAKLIKACGLTECDIYCSDDDKGKNKTTLGEYWEFWKPKTKRGGFSLINFFTCKAFEGWNLKGEPKANLYVATDIHQPHTLVGINKCVQALGRWREDKSNPEAKPNLHHVFNHRGILSFKSIEALTKSYIAKAELMVNHNQIERIHALKSDIVHLPNIELKRFCDEFESSNPVINTYKLDQVINEQYNNEVFNDVSYITKAWTEFGFDTTFLKSHGKWESLRDTNRKTASQTLKDDFLKLVEFNDNIELYWIGANIEETIKTSNPLAYRASKYLTEQQMKELKYNTTKVKAKLVMLEEPKKRIKLSKLIALTFKTYCKYSKAIIKENLQLLYDDVNLMTAQGKPLVAKATDIKQFFDIKECKLTLKDGKVINGFHLLRQSFELKMAA